jgi:hypothetical protein
MAHITTKDHFPVPWSSSIFCAYNQLLYLSPIHDAAKENGPDTSETAALQEFNLRWSEVSRRNALPPNGGRK